MIDVERARLDPTTRCRVAVAAPGLWPGGRDCNAGDRGSLQILLKYFQDKAGRVATWALAGRRVGDRAYGIPYGSAQKHPRRAMDLLRGSPAGGDAGALARVP